MTTDERGRNNYIFDPESPEEMSRLVDWDRITTKGMGGVLAEQSADTISSLHTILDMACGPGGWVLDTAFAHPHIEVTGIDISRIMVDYANARARSQQITNVSFGVMNITQPLDFSDASFDLVNARALFSVLHRDSWIPFLAECTRILRPGGILRLTEVIDFGTTSPAHAQMLAMFNKALHLTGHGFSPDGRTIDVATVLPRMFRRAGYQHIQHATYSIDTSADTDAWADGYHSRMVVAQLAKPLFAKLGLMTPEEAANNYQQMIVEAHSEDLCTMQHYITLWGNKPSHSKPLDSQTEISVG